MVEKAKTADRTVAGMVYFPAAKFMMGSEGVLKPSDEKPRHEVEVSAFYIDKHGVTNAEYNAYLAQNQGNKKFKLVATTDCQSLNQSIVARGDDPIKLFEENKSKMGQCGLHVVLNDQVTQGNPSPAGFDGSYQPVVRVTWPEADAYCKDQGKRLPREAERERAAIGLTKGYDRSREYGTRSGQLSEAEAVYRTNQTANVCSKPTNDAGVCDMAGNTWEWVSDWYSEDYYKNSPATNPTGPSSGFYRVIRGGSWSNDDSGGLRASYRFNDLPDYRYNYVGFRCALSAEDSKKVK